MACEMLVNISSFIKCSKCGGSYAGLRCPHCNEPVMQAEAKARNSTGKIDPPHLQFEAAMAKSKPLKQYVEKLAVVKESLTTPKLRHRRGKMNKTEASMAARLKSEDRAFIFEGVALRWGGTDEAAPMMFSADFFLPDEQLFIEVKGGFIRPRDIVRFRGCRAEWHKWFRFELWQLKNKQWTRLE